MEISAGSASRARSACVGVGRLAMIVEVKVCLVKEVADFAACTLSARAWLCFLQGLAEETTDMGPRAESELRSPKSAS